MIRKTTSRNKSYEIKTWLFPPGLIFTTEIVTCEILVVRVNTASKAEFELPTDTATDEILAVNHAILAH
ncbi:hypothetical protein IMCC3135_15240 [Granulosicoccus antarcticus IMCC3135]|uniref:Uncharacterized protein n=1 Tax=Granulosicoccus antarcticus IMCC3135 TaxID=1192854 RepID=A0A2Z2NNT1_9GAMM|nr:hypothetical protein IMCC3135_15240 [Granulosicoccus antarcticus IMCC3135]